jgi:hypothetical protein
MAKVIVSITTEDGELLERVALILQHDAVASFAAYIANDLTDRFDSEEIKDELPTEIPPAR